VFNGGTYLTQAIESVLENLNGLPFEYIAVNDGSTDNTVEILESYGDKLRVIHQENKGESAAVNVGIQNARGKFCIILNADDLLITPKLFREAAAALTDEQIVLVYCNWVKVDNSGNVLSVQIPKDYSEYELIGKNRCLPSVGTIFRTESAKKVGLRDTKMKFASDYDFYLRLSRMGRFSKLDLIGGAWREHEGSTSSFILDPRMAYERIDSVTKFCEQNQLSKNLNRQALGNSYYFASAVLARLGHTNSHKFLLRSFILRRGIPENFKVSIFLFLMKSSCISILRQVRSLFRRQES
jgi:glycosyltransferase involved in cell wall biosynthesis